MLRSLLNSLLGLFHLGLATRFRVKGAYWKWRTETAFGREGTTWNGASGPSARERRHAMFEYAAWAQRMRRFTR